MSHFDFIAIERRQWILATAGSRGWLVNKWPEHADGYDFCSAGKCCWWETSLKGPSNLGRTLKKSGCPKLAQFAGSLGTISAIGFSD